MREISIKDFDCTYGNSVGIDKTITQKTNLKFPDAYKKWDSMAILSRELKKHENSSFCTLPFCHTLEGEALGGIINYGDDKIGPRGKEYIISNPEDILDLPEIDYSVGRIAEVLKACSYLKSQGEDVALYISGPFTILNILIDPTYIFKAFKKRPEIMKDIFDKLRHEIIRFIEKAQQNGVNIISYGDSSGGLNILGPKFSQQVVELFTYPFIKEVQQLINTDTIVLLCPKTTFALIGTGKAVYKEVNLPEPMKYDKACTTLIGKVKFLGEMCIKNKEYILKDKKIKSIEII